MQVLVVGGGGREHALAWKISQSPLVSKLFCAPGNPGTSFLCENIPLEAEDVEGLLKFADEKKIDLTVVGPEQPLARGIVDLFTEKGLRVFGPSRKSAQLEGSKAFAKELMKKYKIPSADFRTFTRCEEARAYVKEKKFPLVVKADGLAAGKGVVICHELSEAEAAIERIMDEKIFGKAGDCLVIEDFLAGEEASYLAFVDGEDILPMASSQDHKAIFDGDRGPNTGGMGAYSPAPVMAPEIMDRVTREIALPVVQAMKKESRPFRGILYAGLMIGAEGPQVLEFNCRFGDPETQPILLRMKSDIIPFFQACIDGNLKEMKLEWFPDTAVCVVMAAEGYPGPYEKGRPISGLNAGGGVDGAMVFHAGTALKEGKIVTGGGRVLGVTALGKDIRAARDNAYDAVRRIHWDGVYYRTDIGQKALAYKEEKQNIEH